MAHIALRRLLAPRAPLTRGHLFRFGLMVAVLAGLSAYVSARYAIGIDDQVQRCLPYRVFVIDIWRRPAVADLARGDLVAVRLDPAQTPANARWAPGTLMVKRLLANEPGTVVTVSRAGISFARDGETWTHGTALEAAEALGGRAEDYERRLTLGPRQAFLMGDLPNSYDGRYYGAIAERQIAGTVLWAF